MATFSLVNPWLATATKSPHIDLIIGSKIRSAGAASATALTNNRRVSTLLAVSHRICRQAGHAPLQQVTSRAPSRP